MLITSAISVLERQWNVFASCLLRIHIWLRGQDPKHHGKGTGKDAKCLVALPDALHRLQCAKIALGNDGTKSDPGGETMSNCKEPRACWVSYQDDQVDQANLPKPQLWPSTWL